MKYTKSGTVAASLCDTVPKLSVISAFQLTEDMVTEMMRSIRLDGFTVMDQYGALWVFVQNQIEFLTPLAWNEPYAAECYIIPHNDIRLNVETVFRGSNSELAFFSELELCAVDLETHHIRRLSTIGVEPQYTEDSAFEHKLQREKAPLDCTLVDTVTVRSSDIDYAHHTNNISYIRHIMNTYSIREIENTPVTKINIQFKGQTFEGDTLRIEKAALPGCDFFRVMKEESPAIECRVYRSGERLCSIESQS